MSKLHLGKGDACPKVPSNHKGFRLYSMQFCPFAERARLILLAKEIPCEVVNINLTNKPEWFLKLNPKGMVPVLDTGSEIVCESLDICNYLDKLFSRPPTYREKDDDLLIIKSFDKLISLYYSVVHSADKKQLKESFEEIIPLLEDLEKKLQERGLYFAGEYPGMVDYMLWPWAERADVIKFVYKEDLPIDPNNFPNIYNWCKLMRSQPAVKETVISAERLYKASLIKKDTPSNDYDKI